MLAKRALGYTRSTGDAYVVALPIAIAIGRIGCFLAELPLGTATTLPWGMSVDLLELFKFITVNKDPARVDGKSANCGFWAGI